MAKENKDTRKKVVTKAPNEASSLFHSIVAAAMKGNPKPLAKKGAKKKG